MTDRFEEILTPARRRELLALRHQRQAGLTAGGTFDFYERMP